MEARNGSTVSIALAARDALAQSAAPAPFLATGICPLRIYLRAGVRLCSANRAVRMTAERCAFAHSMHFGLADRTSTENRRGNGWPYSAPRLRCVQLTHSVSSVPLFSLPYLHLNSATPSFFSFLPFTPFSFLFFRYIAAIYGLLQEGGKIERTGSANPINRWS